MYSIKSKDADDGEAIKGHAANTYELAQSIAADLKQRFGADSTIEEHKGPPTYDPGGSVVTSDTYTDLGLVHVKDQHLEFFKYYLEKVLKEQPRKGEFGPYYKLHGAWLAVCFSPEEANTVLALLSVEE